MQCVALVSRALPLLPRWPPVLRGRFHDDFLDLLLVQPLGQHVQFTGRSTELAALKLILAFPGDISHHDRQHLLVNVNCCDSIGHHASPWPKRRACQRYIPGRVTWLSPLPRGRPTTPNYSRRARMLLIKQINDLDFFTVRPTLPLPPLPRCQFFMSFRGPKAHPNRSCVNRSGQVDLLPTLVDQLFSDCHAFLL